MQEIAIGILLGLGAAIPIGPINLEIVRRNLQCGTRYGLIFGFGACSADVFYLILLSMGALVLLTHVLVLNIVSIVGALILAWFGISALRIPPLNTDNQEQTTTHSLFKHYVSGLLMTLVNPMTILFWASISAQVTSISHHQQSSTLLTGVGVAIGAFGWDSTLNTLLHFTRHRLSSQFISLLNKIGGIILLIFAVLGLYHNLHLTPL